MRKGRSKASGQSGEITIAVPVCWDAFEPEEGVYNTGYVHAIIDAVRSHGLHGILLWFGTWKKRADGIHAGLGEEGSGTFSEGAV